MFHIVFTNVENNGDILILILQNHHTFPYILTPKAWAACAKTSTKKRVLLEFHHSNFESNKKVELPEVATDCPPPPPPHKKKKKKKKKKPQT